MLLFESHSSDFRGPEPPNGVSDDVRLLHAYGEVVYSKPVSFGERLRVDQELMRFREAELLEP